MSKLRQKSDINIAAAKLLLDKTYYASSVHCSYYSCFQLLKYTIMDFFGIDYVTLSSNISTSEQNTHQYIINFISNKLTEYAGSNDSRDFKRKIKDLKQYRFESDYENIDVTFDKGNVALTKAMEIRHCIITSFKV